GIMDVADIAVCIAVAYPHRKAAYEANEYAMKRIKQIVPMWKKGKGENGATWIGDQLENVAYLTGKPKMEGDNE
ncbi:MAG: molybdenum cofactor biosynthesis protein MoaE, partial [Bacillus sp. (in: Bacteria)]|nr:molybdenum cofactor biosynthesis protein MoaE [Bacillus sp. (in: firmicutes)]